MSLDEAVFRVQEVAPPRVISCQIVPCVDDAAAGPTYSVLSLAAALRLHGHGAETWAVGRRPPEPGLRIFAPGAGVLTRLTASPEMRRALWDALWEETVLHSHGLWLLPNLYPARIARRHRIPLVISPRGMLSAEALAFSAARKRAMWALAQGRALRGAACFHATSEAEAEDIRRVGLTAPIAILPNGIDCTAPEATPTRTILHLGRLHPKKGIDRLIDAWASVAPAHPHWRLRIVGPSEQGTRTALKAQAHALGAPRVSFEDALHGAEKAAAFRDAGLFVLPSLNENFGMVVAEALAAGVPVVTTRGTPWSGMEQARCGWWVPHGVPPLAEALDAALRLPDATRRAMGDRGRKWMARDFGWDGIAAQMADVYAWLLAKAPRPKCVVD
ncbi:MAG: glycosyltransferase [Pseudomonadota bacterium]